MISFFKKSLSSHVATQSIHRFFGETGMDAILFITILEHAYTFLRKKEKQLVSH